jgi:hypothetical protein
MKLGSDPSEFQQLMFLQSLCKGHSIKVGVRGGGIFEGFVVLFLYIKFIEGIVDGFDVSRLHGCEVRFDERDVIRLFKHANNASMIDTGSEGGEKVCEEGGVFLEIKVEGSVVNFKIGRLDNDSFERVMFLLLARPLRRKIPKHQRNVPSWQEQHYQTRRNECRA